MQLVRVNRLHFPVLKLGPGRRLGIWLQGCGIRCPGCVARDTWNEEGSTSVPVEAVVRWCGAIADGATAGATISGGEPFDQPDALEELLQGLRHLGAGDRWDLLCYSGYPWEYLRGRYPHILGLLDALIPEPFVVGLPGGNVWRGSANQSLLCLSDLGVERYSAYVESAVPAGKGLQVSVIGERVYYIGIPERGELDEIGRRLRARGVHQGSVTWRS